MAEDAKKELSPPELPANYLQQAEIKEFGNLVTMMNKGKVFNAEQRRRFAELAGKFATGTGKDFDHVTAAMALGAFDEKADATGGHEGKANRGQTTARIEVFIDWITWGWSTGKICHFSAQRWGCSFRQTKRYIQSANKEMQKRHDALRDRAESRLVARLDETFNLARQSGQISVMRDVLETHSKVMGLNKPVTQRMEIGGPGGAPLAFLDVPDKGGRTEPDNGEPTESKP